ncbi:putative integral membrane protein [Histoplasma ohiense]|nr:putative integral membrane protein [Histoplasma ohiense (nom. inval.)]
MYSSSAPDELTRWEVITTLLVSWWCTGCSLAIIFVRVIGRYLRTQVLFPEDWIMLASVIPLLIRMGLVHLVLIYGTNNVIDTNLSDIQIRQREIGSELVLGARIFYSLFIWTAKYTITEFLTRLTAQTWRRSFQLMLNFICLFLVATFAAVAISTLAECQPFPQLLAGQSNARTQMPAGICAPGGHGCLRCRNRYAACRFPNSYHRCFDDVYLSKISSHSPLRLIPHFCCNYLLSCTGSDSMSGKPTIPLSIFLSRNRSRHGNL